MPEISTSRLVYIVRANPPAALLEYYVPTVDKCPHCGEHRKEGVNFTGRGYEVRHVDPDIAIKFRTIAGKKTVLLGRKICTDECLEKELTKMVERLTPLAVDVLTNFALTSGYDNGTAFKLDTEGYRNQGLMFWDNKQRKIIPSDGDLNGGYGGVPINFPVGDGDFTPDMWSDDFLEGVVCAYPNMNLIVEMKNYAAANPEAKRMSLTINKRKFNITYDPKEMAGKWNTCTIALLYGKIEVNTGEGQRLTTYNPAGLEAAEAYVAAKTGVKGNNRRTIKASNENAGLNRLAAIKGLKAQQAPNSNAFKALNAEEKNLIMKHLGGTKRKRKSQRKTRRNYTV
jgi:hypothetical protein